MNLRAFINIIVQLALPLCSYAQPGEIKKQIDAQLLFDGKELMSGKDSMGIAEFVRLFVQDKVTVGHTSMTLVGFCITELPPGRDIIGPDCCSPYVGIDGHSATDTLSINQRMANFIKKKFKSNLPYVYKGHKVFIDNAIARMPNGNLCKVMKGSVFIAK